MPYQHIFFDLDHTLWDFEKNSSETLTELYFEYDIGYHGNIDEQTYIQAFREVNRELWTKYDKSQIDKEYIRTKRFELIFGRLGIDPKKIASNIGDVYLFRCPKKPHLLPHSKEILDYLSKNYQLHILTNGFNDVQAIKLKHSGISHYFQTIVTSESTGHRKPSQEIFEYALEQAQAPLQHSLMIGDNLDTDIEGALRIGMDAVFYNPDQVFHKKTPRYEIKCLRELGGIL